MMLRLRLWDVTVIITLFGWLVAGVDLFFKKTRIVPVRCYGQTTKLFHCSPNYCTGKKHEGSLLERVTISSLLKNSRIAQARKFAKLKYYTWYYTCQG
jgi:hypothetical protein